MTLRERQYLLEGMFTINKDVDYLYKKAKLGRLHGLLKKGNMKGLEKALDSFKTVLVSSSELRSRAARKANKVNPIGIRLTIGSEGSYYKPAEKVIQISLNHNAYGLLRNTGYNQSAIKDIIGTQYSRFVGEFDAENVKGTIAHELSHWLNDSLHGKAVARTLAVVREKGVEAASGKFLTMRQHPIEIDAQVHAVREVRREMGKRAYDKLTWPDLFRKKNSLPGNFRDNRGQPLLPKQYNDTMKRLVKRLHREGLLGKGMKRLPTYAQMLGVLKGI